ADPGSAEDQRESKRRCQAEPGPSSQSQTQIQTAKDEQNPNGRSSFKSRMKAIAFTRFFSLAVHLSLCWTALSVKESLSRRRI
ncbi:hypothetical protein K435DRAFT_774315, partial [Dendrothele bispora CBS 962.96]